jgi:O-glycosyl hydrolase
MRAFCLLFAALPLLAQNAVFDSSGRLTHLVYDGEELNVRTTLAATLRGRTKIVMLGETSGSRDKRSPDHWTGKLEPEQDVRAGYDQTVTVRDGKTEIALQITDVSNLKDVGLYFVIQVPWETFAGGTALGQALPRTKPVEAVVASARAARSVRLENAAHDLTLAAELDIESPVEIRDEWDKSGHFYSVWIALNRGALRTTLSLAGKGDHAPAALKLNAANRRYKFDGFGGNYCFEIESPTTQYTLKNLRVRWARTEMTLLGWAPESDKPDSRWRHEFELAKQIQGMGIPYVISIWQVPGWAVAEPEESPFRERHRIAVAKWDELVESIGSYLSYARQKYGVEPDLFSFNEANIGINVLLTPEEHRDAIKSLGRRFAQLGLKTKLLLGDATGPAGTHKWALAAANDPDVRPFIGAVAFHSWGGGTAEQYKAWGDLAEWLNLPLLVTELGVDPFAYRSGMYDSYDYGLHEVRMYQELLLHARPQGTMQWEFTADYGLVKENGAELTPTPRFWLVKHFTDLTLRDSDAIETASSRKDVLVTAFTKDGAYAVHIANLGTSREATIDGLPAGSWRVVSTTEAEPFRDLAPLTASGGSLKLSLPARSLLTLSK